jgi:hypothetical protein
MDPFEIGMYAIPIALAILVFRLAWSMEWSWGLCIFFAVIPMVATYFLRVYGLLASAMYVGAMYKACAGSRR